MTRVDFYQVSRDPAPEVVAMLARRTLGAGERLLVVAEGAARLEAISTALWSTRERDGSDTFLANGLAGSPHDARQPILLSERVEPANGARFLALADGQWRESEGFARVFLVFDDATLDAARACWRDLGTRQDLERNFWRQDGASWVKAG